MKRFVLRLIVGGGMGALVGGALGALGETVYRLIVGVGSSDGSDPAVLGAFTAALLCLFPGALAGIVGYLLAARAVAKTDEDGRRGRRLATTLIGAALASAVLTATLWAAVILAVSYCSNAPPGACG